MLYPRGSFGPCGTFRWVTYRPTIWNSTLLNNILTFTFIQQGPELTQLCTDPDPLNLKTKAFMSFLVPTSWVSSSPSLPLRALNTYLREVGTRQGLGGSRSPCQSPAHPNTMAGRHAVSLSLVFHSKCCQYLTCSSSHAAFELWQGLLGLACDNRFPGTVVDSFFKLSHPTSKHFYQT